MTLSAEMTGDQLLKGRTAVVTGGAGGIGRYICQGLATAGAAVVVADIGDASSALTLVTETGGRALALECDIADPKAVHALAAETRRAFKNCDILIHCAAYQPHRQFDQVQFSEWRKTLAVNLDALFLLSQAFLPGMKANGWGRIISLTSATFYDATVHHTEYVASKAGIMGLTRILAREMGKYGITANAIAPGLVRTPNSEAAVQFMLDAGEPNYFELQNSQQCIPYTLEPRDIVDPVVFLASDQARAITGQSILVDNGWKYL
jgi:NAD(P)-dependent dehydrogenase (short-subunit alcohol dehydrogenase family)